MANDLKIQVIVDGSQVSAGMANVMSDVEASTGKAAGALSALSESTEKAEYSMTEARHAIRGMGEEIGVHMPRFVSSFVAGIGGIGPALAAAFTPIAVIGLVEVLAQLPAKFDEIIGKLAGWDEAAKTAIASQGALNNKIIEAAHALALEKIANDEAGLKGSARTQQEITDIGKRIDLLKQYQGEQAKIAVDAQKELDAIAVIPAHLQGRIMVQQTEGPAIEKGSDAWKERTKIITDATAKIAQYAAEIQKLQQVETPRKQATLGMEQSDAAIAAAKARQAEEDRLAKEAARLKHEQIIAELNDEERAAKEEIKLREEEAKENAEALRSMDEEEKKSAEKTEKEWNDAWKAIAEAEKKQFEAIEKVQDQALKKAQSVADSIGHSFDSAFRSMLAGGQSWERKMAQLGDSLLNDFMEIFLKMGEKWLATHILMLAAHSSFLSNILGLDAANNAAKQAVNTVAADAQVTQQAGIAGAAAFASVMAALPFPANVAVAPEVMASAIAQAMSNLALASAAGGMWDVPNDMLVKVHENESILPAWAASGLRQQIAGGGGGHTFNQHISVTSPDLVGSVSKSGKQIVNLAMRELRKRNYR